MTAREPALSIVIPAWNEAENLAHLLPRLRRLTEEMNLDCEILVADHESSDHTVAVCRENKALLLNVAERGYGRALRAAFNDSRGKYLITMDADLSHPSEFVEELWKNRGRADVIIASRYVKGGRAEMTLTRRALSRILNWTFAKALDIPVHDLSSGFRLYRRTVLDEIDPVGKDFNVLQEILIKAYSRGFRVLEVPFAYRRRGAGSTHARLIAFGIQYLKTFGHMWRLRNSIESGDYDLRAFDSRIPLQRWWQRRRHKIISGWASEKAVLDVGCGSSRILESLPPGSIGVDPFIPNLRHARKFGKHVVAGALPEVPIASGSFAMLLCSQVIEHIPADERIFGEFRRLVAPGGELILGTPDYGRLAWRVTEALYRYLIPGGYADDHITRYSRADLEKELEAHGFRVLQAAYVGGGELILRCRREG